MQRTTRLDLLKPSILAALLAKPHRVVTLKDLRELRWGVAPLVSEPDFITFLLEEGILQQTVLESPKYPGFIRYTLPKASRFEVALSLRRGSYLSHGSAMFLHGLTDQVPQRIYVNREQSPKVVSEGEITQDGVKKAFARHPREANYALAGPGYEVVLLSGKHTGRLGVVSLPGPDGESLETTKLERTLIDITVRPVYAGGVTRVLEAYRGARGRLSHTTLLQTLKTLEYRYPYHQAIGFYMERAGYDERLLERVAQLAMNLDFYLAHGRERAAYSKRWRLFFPETL
jgi:predicted transcriptional regulator of viral defense system